MKKCCLLLLLFGCGTPVPQDAGDAGGAFPHGERFLWEHAEAAERNISGCLDCHGVDEDDIIEGATTPHCELCHGFPDELLEEDS
jgi:hypothetical protein